MSSVQIAALGFALLLAAVHGFAGKLRFLDVVPRSRWLSLSSGVSVAYIFIHVLPELARGQAVIEANLTSGWAKALESHIYLVAMLGMAVFYGLERMVRSDTSKRGAQDSDEPTGPGTFAIHLGSFALYNLLVGYLLLHREQPGLVSLALFGLAMATHFLVNDYGLRQDHKRRYRDLGRWLLAGAVLLGWLVGMVVRVGEVLVSVFFAFLAGAVILNVLKEELPAARASRFLPFAIGMAAYAALLILAAK